MSRTFHMVSALVTGLVLFAPGVAATAAPLSEVQVDAGLRHACAVRTDGTPVCWGDNEFGKATAPQGVTVTAISAGANHTCAIKTNGNPICWGDNSFGQVAPDYLGWPFTQRYTAISAGGRHTCAIRAEGGGVDCWGDNQFLQVDVPITEPGDVGVDRGVTAISAGVYHTCAIAEDGSPICWGADFLGGPFSSRPRESSGVKVTAIAAGGGFSCAVKTDGTPICWDLSGDDILLDRPPGAVTEISASISDFYPPNPCWVHDGVASCYQSPDVWFGQIFPVVRGISQGDGFACGVKWRIWETGAFCAGDNRFGQLGVAPAFTSAPPPDGSGHPYSHTFTATAGSGALAPRFDIVDTGPNGVPPGLALDGETGVLSGTPTTDGTYRLVVRVSDGVFSAHQDVSITIDATPPAVTLTAPADGALGNDASPGFTGIGGTAANDQAEVTVGIWSGSAVGSGEPDYTVSAARDGSTGDYSTSGPFTKVSDSSTVAALPDGVYIARAFQSDAATNEGRSTATPTFTIDTTPPAVTLTAPADGALTHDDSPAFAGQGGTAARDQAGVTVKIWSGSSVGPGAADYMVSAARDGSTGDYSTSGPFTRVSDSATIGVLPDGVYTARAFQSDALANEGQSSQSPTFTIDAPPDTAIGSGPPDSTSVRSVQFTFGATDANAGGTLRCRLDGPGATTGVFTDCKSPQRYSGLRVGSYTFQVAAVDAAGNQDPSPATRAFTIKLPH